MGQNVKSTSNVLAPEAAIHADSLVAGTSRLLDSALALGDLLLAEGACSRPEWFITKRLG